MRALNDLGLVVDMTNHTGTDHVPTYTNTPINVSKSRAEYWNDLGLSDLHRERLHTIGTHDEATLATLTDLALELAVFQEDHPPALALQGFIDAASDHADAIERLAVINTIERLAGLRRRNGERVGLDPVEWPGWIDPNDPHRIRRQLGAVEFALIRLCAFDRSAQHTAVIGLGEASATNGELASILPDSIDVEVRRVRLPGRRGVDARTMALPAWAAPSIIALARACEGQDRCILTRSDDDKANTRAATGMAANKVMRDAGLRGDKSASFDSLRLTIARRCHDIRGTDAAVKFLGESNYETVLNKISVRPAAERPNRSAA